MERKRRIYAGAGAAVAAVMFAVASGMLVWSFGAGDHASAPHGRAATAAALPPQPRGATNGTEGQTGTGPAAARTESAAGKSAMTLQDTSFQQEHPARIYYRDKVIALMYHEVTPGQKDRQSLDVVKFERQLSLMKESGFQWITMKQYAAFVLHGSPVPPNAVLMTFDDGYESFYEYAYPLLLKYHVPATSFLIVNTVGNPKHAGIPKLDWEQVREMHANGVDFYSHSFDSHRYAPLDAGGKRSKAALRGPVWNAQLGRKETQGEYAARVRRDLEQANAVLREKIGNAMQVIAFPYGVFSPSLLRICKELDMQVTFTVMPGINRPGGLNGYRLNAGGADNDPESLIALMKRGAVPASNQTKPGPGRSGAKPPAKPPVTAKPKTGGTRIAAE